MLTIAIAFDPDGSVEFTRNKNLDQFFGGAGDMKRVTDIQKLRTEPLFFIKWLMGPFAGANGTGVHKLEHHDAVFGKEYNELFGFACNRTGTVFFRTYEAAVTYEIACLNKMRENGVTFDAF